MWKEGNVDACPKYSAIWAVATDLRIIIPEPIWICAPECS